MSATTKIQWTDRTWNPVRGCSLVSAGCANCYAMKQAHRFSGMGRPYENLTEIGPKGPRWNGNIMLVPQALREPLTWKTPCRVFVNSMSDLFHEDVPDGFIADVFDVMARCPQHTFQVLTKRPIRMSEWAGSRRWVADGFSEESAEQYLPNVWLGVSIEDQETADERIPLLLQTPAAVRFVSAEPLLGPVDFSHETEVGVLSWLNRYEFGSEIANGLDWVIVGGESGPGARPCDLAWIRSIKDQCKDAAVPCFVKQLGSVPMMDEKEWSARNWAWLLSANHRDRVPDTHVPLKVEDSKGGDWSEWPEDLRVREWPR